MSAFAKFHPDLIVEATAVCDRACAGCYAANVVSTKNPSQLYEEKPELFLSPEDVVRTLGSFSPQSLKLVSIRGGEPARHPFLDRIVSACLRIARTVCVETHGRWLLPEQREAFHRLIGEIEAQKAVIKLSFDGMHGLTIQQLMQITEFLDERSIGYLVAITELNEEAFLDRRKLCDWVPDSRIVYQPKASELTGLVLPRHGVLTVNGTLKTALTVRRGFLPNSDDQVPSLGRASV